MEKIDWDAEIAELRASKEKKSATEKDLSAKSPNKGKIAAIVASVALAPAGFAGVAIKINSGGEKGPATADFVSPSTKDSQPGAKATKVEPKKPKTKDRVGRADTSKNKEDTQPQSSSAASEASRSSVPAVKATAPTATSITKTEKAPILTTEVVGSGGEQYESAPSVRPEGGVAKNSAPAAAETFDPHPGAYVSSYDSNSGGAPVNPDSPTGGYTAGR
jgi:hypothetical protein